MSRLGEFILVFAVVLGVGLYVSQTVTCWHIPYITTGCTVK